MRRAGLNRALAAAPWAALDAVTTALYGVLFLFVVGRLIGPAELGLASSALAFVLLVEAVSSAGLQEAVIRLPGADTRRTDATHALAVALSLAAMPIAWLAAWRYGVATGEPRLLPLVAFASVMLPLNAIACVPTALLVRKMRGRQLLLRPITGKIAGIGVLIGLAAAGARASAIVAASVATSLGGAVALYAATTRRPRLRWDRRVAAAQLRFGLLAGVDGLFWMVGLRLFTLAFAAAFGMRALGQLQLALRLVEEVSRLLQSIVMRYALALFAELRRAKADVAPTLLRATGLLNAAAVPAFVALACIGDLVVVATFGGPWSQAGGAVRLLAAASVLTFARMLVTPALKAIGRPDRVALAASVNFASALAVIASLRVVEAPVAVALWAARELLALAIWAVLARHHLGVSLGDGARALAPSWAAGGVMALLLAALRHVLEPGPLVAVGALAYGALFWSGKRVPLAGLLGAAGGGRWRRSTS